MTQEDMDFFVKLFHSLEEQMSQRFESMGNLMGQRFDQVNARLDQANARLEKLGGLVNSGGKS